MKTILLRVLNCLREDKMYDKYISLSDRNFRVCGATNFSNTLG
jgi:hypothetical protein